MHSRLNHMSCADLYCNKEMFFLFPDVIIVTRSGPGEREQSPGHAVSRKTGESFLFTGPGVPVQCQSIAGNILGEITLMDAVSRSI